MNDDLPELPELPEATPVSTRRQLKALESPVRMRILALCKRPMSVRAMAERLEVPKTTLYYHVDLLEDAGFVEVVHVRKSGARLERIYRVTGRAIVHDADMASQLGDPIDASRAMVAVVLEPTRVEAESALADHLQGGSRLFYLGRDQASLTDTDAAEFRRRLADLVREWFVERDAGDDPDARPYAVTYALTRTDPR